MNVTHLTALERLTVLHLQLRPGMSTPEIVAITGSKAEKHLRRFIKTMVAVGGFRADTGVDGFVRYSVAVSQ